MAQYEIRRACGHTETIQITGTNVLGERERRAAWESHRPCRDCHLSGAEQAAEIEVRNYGGLPALDGSPKQVAWADRIRAETLPKLDDLRLRIGHGLGHQPHEVKRADMLAAALDTALRSKTTARWWIDRRSANSAYLAIHDEAVATVKREDPR